MSRNEKKSVKLDDEIMLAGLEALVPESLANFQRYAPGDCDVRGSKIWLKDP